VGSAEPVEHCVVITVVRDVVNDNNTMSTTIVRGCNGAESLLACDNKLGMATFRRGKVNIPAVSHYTEIFAIRLVSVF
jgi:hypothetical protein